MDDFETIDDFIGDVWDTRDLIDLIDRGEDIEPEELARAKALAEELESYCGDQLNDGNTVIADRYFVEYARELAEDIGAIDRNASWPLSYIDWDTAAEALKQDYSAVEFEGQTWWVR